MSEWPGKLKSMTTPSAQTVTADAYAMTAANLRRRSQAVYLACEEPVAKDLSESLKWAADEIDRLTGKIGAIAFALGWTDLQGVSVEEYAHSLAAADARGKRLEEALREIAEHPAKSAPGANPSYAVGWAFWHVQKLASAALSQTEGALIPDSVLRETAAQATAAAARVIEDARVDPESKRKPTWRTSQTEEGR